MNLPDIKWHGSWDELKRHALNTWDGLTRDDVDVPDGDWAQLVDRIRERTGDSVQQIRTLLEAEEDILLDSDSDDFDRL